MASGVIEGETGVEDVIDEEDVASLKVSAAMLEATNFSGGTGAFVTGDIPEFDLGIGGKMAKNIHDKKDAAFQEGNDRQRTFLVGPSDGGGQSPNPLANPRGGKVGLPGRAVHCPAAVGVRRSNSWEILAVRGPSILRLRPFCQEFRAFCSSSS